MVIFGKKKKKEEIPKVGLEELKIPEIHEIPEIKIKDISKSELTPLETEKEITEIKPLPPITPLKSEIESEIEKEEVKGPIFVKITKYKKVLEAVEKLGKSIEEMEMELTKIKENRTKFEEEIKKIDEELGEMKRKISEIENTLFSKIK